MIEALAKSICPADSDLSLDLDIRHLPVMRIQVRVTANAFLLALHRRHSRSHLANRSLAIDAALKIHSEQDKLFHIMDQAPHKIFMLSFYSVDAGLYLAAVISRHSFDNPYLVRQVRQKLSRATERLSWMADKSPVAASGLTAIRRICQDHRQVQTARERHTDRDAAFLPGHPGFAADDVTPISPLGSEVQIAGLDLPVNPGVCSPGADACLQVNNSSVEDRPGNPPQLAYHFDPFMGVTDLDYTIENFLSELF